jgi:multiple sugar transport system substrate-binding protein
MTSKLSRRDLLKLSGTVAASAVLAACGQAAPPTTAPEATQAPEVQEPEPTQAPEVEETEAPEVQEPEPTQAPPAKAVEGTVYVMHQRSEFSEDQENQFESENPGIQIEFIEHELTRFFAMNAAGNPPDLYRTQAPMIPQFLARKLLFDLTPFFETSEILKMDDLMPANDYYKANSPLDIGEGPIYGMCKDFSPDLTVYANKGLLETAGVTVPDDTKALTYDEIFDIARKTTKMEGDRVVNMGYGYEGGWLDRIMMVALAEKDMRLYSDTFDKIIISENEEARKLVQFYFDMAKEKVTASPVNPSPNGWFGTDFTANILALAQYGFWYSAMAVSDQNLGNIMMLPAPTWSGKRLNPTITATGMIMVSASKLPEAAWKVFEFYNGGQPAIDRAKSGWGVPALKSQLDLIPQETDFQKQANKVLQGELALNTPPVQFNPFIGEGVFSDAWNNYLNQALNDEITVDEMIANIESEVNLAITEGIDRISG